LLGADACGPLRCPAGLEQEWHWGFYSCSGFSFDVSPEDQRDKWGGGHACLNDSGYDCSGTVSYVLREAGIIKGSMPSKAFLSYGKRGEGKWITIYSRNGHVFMTIAGLRLDTGGDGQRSGPKWKPWKRGAKGYIMRHPPGL
jgi:hypothetical protein